MNPEIIRAQQIENGILNATLEILHHSNVLPFTVGDVMRSILKEAHQVFDEQWQQAGAFYVTHGQGGFELHPFGTGARHRNWYRISIDRQYDLWIFNVMGREL